MKIFHLNRLLIAMVTTIAMHLGLSQTSSIVVIGNVQGPPAATRCELFFKDSLIAEKYFSNFYYFLFDSLKAEEYRVLLYINNELSYANNHIVLKEGQRYVYHVDNWRASMLQDSTGNLYVNIFSDLNGNDVVDFKLLSDDVLVQSKKYNDEGFIQFQALTPGNYSLRVFIDGKLQSTYHRIKISPMEETQFDISLYNFYNKKQAPNIQPIDTTTTKIQITPYVLFGSPYMENNLKSPIAGNLKIGVTQEFYTLNNKFINPAFQIGFSVDVASFNQKWDTTILPNRRRENYVSGKIAIGFITKITTYNFGKTDIFDHKFALDLGIQYHLPVLFHYTAAKGSTAVRKYFIHQFTDATAMVRLSYDYFGLICEVRLMDYLLGNYPELPRFKIGICVPIHNE